MQVQLLSNKFTSERMCAGSVLRLGSLRDFRKSGDQQDQLGLFQGTVIDAEVIEERKLSVKDTEIIEVPEQKVLLPGCNCNSRFEFKTTI